MKSLLFLVLTFALISCGKSGGGSKSSPVPDPVIIPNASIFSTWVPDNGSTTLNFTPYQYDTIAAISLGSCNLNVLFEDEDDQGEAYNLIAMTFSGGTGSCTGFNGTWLVAVEGNDMEMCQPPSYSTCFTYQKQ